MQVLKIRDDHVIISQEYFDEELVSVKRMTARTDPDDERSHVSQNLENAGDRQAGSIHAAALPFAIASWTICRIGNLPSMR
jgi:hypothetical protein